MTKRWRSVCSGFLLLIANGAASFSLSPNASFETRRQRKRTRLFLGAGVPDDKKSEPGLALDDVVEVEVTKEKIRTVSGKEYPEWINFQECEILDDDLLMNVKMNDDDVAIHDWIETDEPIVTKNPISMEDLMSFTTKGTNIAYFYLQNEVGIAEDDMWKITHEAGSILGMTANNLRRKVHLMTRLMDLEEGDVRTMLVRHPAVLHLSAKQNIAPTILFLQRSLDLSRKDLRAMIVPFPSILGYSLPNLKSKLNFYLKVCQFSKDEARQLFVAEPKLLTAGVKTGLIPRMHFFVNFLEFPLDGLREVVKKNPRVLLCSLEKNLRPKLQFYLIMTLGMDIPTVQTILRKYPQILNYNLENHILPITRYFVQDLLFSNQEFSKILLKFPRLVSWSLYKIKHVVGYLRFELGMDASQTKRVLYQAPQVINLNTEETLKPRIEYFRHVFKLTDQEVRQVIAGMPTLAICSVETNLKPKIDYLTEVLGTEEMKFAILLLPTLLGYSLENRIVPRMRQVLEANVHPRSITVGIPMKEEAFQRWLNGRRSRAVLEPGYDDVRYTKTPEGVRLPSLKSLSTKPDTSGRIVHWSRPRQIPANQTREIS